MRKLNETGIIHAGTDKKLFDGASSVPVYQASTFNQADPNNHSGYEYARSANPTRGAVEKAVAELEGGVQAFAFSSGMAAVCSALMMLQANDHIIATEDIYGGTFRALSQLFTKWKIEVDFVDMTDTANIEKVIKPNTKAIYAETPSNPLLKITDLRAVAGIAKKHKLISLVDNTFATPYLQRPIELGFDVVLHSATKFLNGHSDVLAGIAVAGNKEIAARLGFIHNCFGAVLGVQDSWLLLRGIKTLGVRMEKSQQSAATIAIELEKLEQIEEVYYPGLANHPHREINESQSAGAGAVLSFRLKEGIDTGDFLKNIKLALVSVSLGGVESILSWPVKMSHASMPENERLKRGITTQLLRLSVGLENPEDILADIKNALISIS